MDLLNFFKSCCEGLGLKKVIRILYVIWMFQTIRWKYGVVGVLIIWFSITFVNSLFYVKHVSLNDINKTCTYVCLHNESFVCEEVIKWSKLLPFWEDEKFCVQYPHNFISSGDKRKAGYVSGAGSHPKYLFLLGSNSVTINCFT